jgi:hypothetical protein
MRYSPYSVDQKSVLYFHASLNRKESYPQMNMLELILWVSLMWIIVYSGVILIS